MRIDKEKSIGLIVDVQERLIPVIHDHEKIIRNIQILVRGLKILGVPLLWMEQYRKGLGETVESLRKLLDPVHPIEKVCFSCCDHPAFMENLALNNKQYVIMAGVESHICVMQTAIDLIYSGYTPVIIEDCISSRTPENRRIGIKRMRDEGAVTGSVESILFELCREAGTDTFKEISKLVK
ncbi:MAG: hydrolase [Bacteroidales bacterium]|jgi:nicotinamidase-related amidase|nr:hydrolase [Bacteroidales bacterium]